MKIIYLTDMDAMGSGYGGISVALCNGLAGLGHEIIVIGLSYKGEEHNYPFSIIPCTNFPESMAMFNNLYHLWHPDVFIVAMDITIQRCYIFEIQKYNIPYIVITPVESDPLCITWGMVLMQASTVFIISEFGAKECNKIGIPAEHLRVGVDTVSWARPTPEQKTRIRASLLGVENDSTFVILTVAANQERKFLSRSLEIIKKYSDDTSDDFRYVMVTEEHCLVGWELRDLAREFDMDDRFIILEKGLSFKQLWSVYAAADVFLLTSKTEGLGMPVMEAMSVGVPVVGTNCGGIREHITNGAGWLIDYEEPPHRDPFGNGRRYFARIDKGAEALADVRYCLRTDLWDKINIARKYVESRTWDIPIKQMDEAIRRVTEHGQAPQETATETSTGSETTII